MLSLSIFCTEVCNVLIVSMRSRNSEIPRGLSPGISIKQKNLSQNLDFEDE
jgi:hypothetical protein